MVMNSLTQEDLIPQAEYEQQREAFRRRIIDLKRRRRISIGPLVTLVFENRDWPAYPVPHMADVEIWGVATCALHALRPKGPSR